MIDVSIVVVTFNAGQWVQRCLAAIPASASSVNVETVVLDNASTEFTREELVTWTGGQSATVIAMPANVGFGRGCNLAAASATGEYLLLLNPDAVISPGSVDKMVDFMSSNPRVGILGGRVTDPDGRLDYGSCFGFQTLRSLVLFATCLSTAFPRSARLNPEGLGKWPRDSARQVDIVTGCLLMVRRSLWDRLGGFDENFFMYGEDADLCQRALSTGSESWIIPGAHVVHAVGASSQSTARKQILLFRGKASLAIKQYSGWKRTAAIGLLQVGVAARAAGEAVLRTDRAAWRPLWSARANWRRGW